MPQGNVGSELAQLTAGTSSARAWQNLRQSSGKTSRKAYGHLMFAVWPAGHIQADAIANLAEQQGNVGEELAQLAAEHGQLSARLAEAKAAEQKLAALAQLQQRLSDFDVLLSGGV